MSRATEAARRALSSALARDTGVLVVGVAISQAIALGAMPIITRLFAPDEFGIFASFASLVGIAGVFACLYFEAVIPLARSDSEAASIVVLALISVCATTAIAALAVTYLGHHLVAQLGAPSLDSSLWLLPVNIALLGAFQACLYLALRNRRFASVSAARVGQTLSVSGAQVAAGLGRGGAAGLIQGYTIGQLIATLAMAPHAYSFVRKAFAKRSDLVELIVGSARRYLPIAAFGSLGTFMVTASYQVIPLLLTSYYGPAAAGTFFITYRVASIPISLLGGPIGQVLLQRASERVAADQPTAELVEESLLTLVRLGLLPFVMVAILAPSAFSFVFGDQWRDAGAIFQVLAIPFFLQFVTGPVSSVLIALRKQKIVAQLQTVMFASAVGTLTAGYLLSFGMIGSISLYAVSLTAIYTYYLHIVCKYSSASGARVLHRVMGRP